jgi:hypothetical protein
LASARNGAKAGVLPGRASYLVKGMPECQQSSGCRRSPLSRLRSLSVSQPTFWPKACDAKGVSNAT